MAWFWFEINVNTDYISVTLGLSAEECYIFKIYHLNKQ